MFQHTIQTTRNLAKGFYPIELERGGFAMALLDLAQRVTLQTQVNCQFQNEESFAISPDKEIHLYRIVQEAINNAIKHGKPRNILIECTSVNGISTLRVTDDGLGFKQPKTGEAGMGLHLFQYRARMVGAKIEVTTGDGGGCKVTCSMGYLPEERRAIGA